MKWLLDNLPEIILGMYALYVRRSIEAGLAASEAGKAVDVRVIREKFGLPS